MLFENRFAKAAAMVAAFALILACLPKTEAQEASPARPSLKKAEPADSQTPKPPGKVGDDDKKPVAVEAKLDDPIAKASFRQREIEQGSNELGKMLGELEILVQEVQPGNWKAEKKTIAQFQRYLIQVQVVGKKIDDAEGDVRFMAGHLKATMEKAVPELERVAIDHEKAAQREKIAEIRQRFLELAKDARVQGADLAKDSEFFDAKVHQILEGLEFVRGSVRLAAAMEKHLGLVPDAAKLAYLDRFLAVLDAHAGQFRKSVSIWREFQDRRRGGGLTPGLPLPPALPPGFDPIVPPAMDPTPQGPTQKSEGKVSQAPNGQSPAAVIDPIAIVVDSESANRVAFTKEGADDVLHNLVRRTLQCWCIFVD